MNNAELQPCHSDDELNLVQVLIFLAKYKKIIILSPIVAAVFAIALTFLVPPSYKASIKLLPPQQAQSGAALLSQLGGVAGLAGGLSGLKNPNDLYVGMIKSRTVADQLISRFNLKTFYLTDSHEVARSKLQNDTTVTSGKDGLITIEVESQDRKLVAPLTNAYVEELLKLTRTLAVTEASQRRLFFERQLEMAKNNLVVAEVKLKSAMSVKGMVSVDSESSALLVNSARLKAQVSAKEIQLNSMQAFYTESHPEYKRLKEELNSLNRELFKLENGNGSAQNSTGSGGSSNGLENVQLLRDLKYYQMLYELLAKQYEMARLEEARDPSIVQILDPAIDPEHKFKPKRILAALLASILALFSALIWAYFCESKKRLLRTEQGPKQWEELKSLMKLKFR